MIAAAAMRASVVVAIGLMLATLGCLNVAPRARAAQVSMDDSQPAPGAETTDDPQPKPSPEPPGGQPLLPMSCPGADVKSMVVSPSPVSEILVDSPQATLLVVGQDASRPTLDAGGKDLTIVLMGPYSASMDSPDVKTELSCAEQGIRLTATTTRSAAYTGSTLANIIWRPNITVQVAIHQPAIQVQAIWRMRLSSGQELNEALTPPYPVQQYPISLSQTVP